MSDDPNTITITAHEYIHSLGKLGAHVQNIDKKLDRLIRLLEREPSGERVAEQVRAHLSAAYASVVENGKR